MIKALFLQGKELSYNYQYKKGYSMYVSNLYGEDIKSLNNIKGTYWYAYI